MKWVAIDLSFLVMEHNEQQIRKRRLIDLWRRIVLNGPSGTAVCFAY